MSESTKPTLNEAENGNKSKPLLSYRLFRFRAWNEKIKWMSKPFTFGQSLNFHDQIIKSLTADEIVMQFTGLKDKNEKEIYEGDILQTKNNIVTVFFGKHISYVLIFGKKDTIETNGWLVKNNKNHTDVLDESFCNGEILGNIFENPELL